MTKKLTVDKINAALQAAAEEDMEEVYESPMTPGIRGLGPDVEGWDEFVERVVAEGPPPEDLEEEV